MSEKKQHKCGSMTFATAAVCAFLVALVLGIGATFAALNDGVKHPQNQDYPDAKLVQTWGDEVVTSVWPGYETTRTALAKNTGDETMYVRMRVNKFWADRDSRTSKEDNKNDTSANNATGDTGSKLVPTTNTAFNKNYIEIGFDNTDKWVDGGDGWWYYTDPIAPGASSESLLSSVKISEQIGEENNDGEQTSTEHGNVNSIYLNEAAVIDVELDAVTTEEEKPSPKPEPEPTPTPTPDNNDDNNNSSTDSTSKTTEAAMAPWKLKQAQQAGIAKTGDGLSPLVLTLFSLAAIALFSCILLLVFSKRRKKQEEEEVATLRC